MRYVVLIPFRFFIIPETPNIWAQICGEHSAILAPENIAPWASPEAEPKEIPEDRLLAEEQKRFESATRLSYPSWQGEYGDAVMEADTAQLFKKVEVAQAAVLTRLDELQHQSDRATERHQLMRAWRVLQIIKRDKLGFVE